MARLVLVAAAVIIVGAVVLVIVLRDGATEQAPVQKTDNTELARQWEKIRDSNEQPSGVREPQEDKSEKKAQTVGTRPEYPPVELGPIGFEKFWESHLLDKEITGMWLLDGGIFAVTKEHWLYKIDPKTGYVLWVYDVGAGIKAKPCVYIYGDSEKSVEDRCDELYLLADGSVRCVDLEAGFLIWRHELRFTPSNTVFAGASFFYYDTGDGKLHAVDKEKKEIKWEYATGTKAGITGVQKSPDIFFVSGGGKIYRADASKEVIKWEFSGKEPFNTPPCLYEERLYIGSQDSKLYALRTEDGTGDWEFTCGAPVVDTPVAVDETVFFRDKSGCFYAANRTTGKEKWRLQGGVQLLLMGRKNAYVLTGEKQIAAVENETGKLLWKKPFVNVDFFLTNPADLLAVRKGVSDYVIYCGFKNAWFFSIREKASD